jgi:glycosyltransferase involved in cell wall biosynthesis
LRSLYPFAHEIIVVEGASHNAAPAATVDGHSIDGTLDLLRRFKIEEDLEDKLTIVTAEDHGYSNGFWPGEKDEQSNAYARRASGDFLWQVDVDEFYHAEDIRRVATLLVSRPEISGVSFCWKNFWGGFGYLVDGWDYRDLVRRMGGIRRIFRWRPSYYYAAHRPPTVLDEKGRDLFELNWISSDETAKMRIYCYHYGMVLPTQARQKTIYYKNLLPVCHDMPKWYQEIFLELRQPFNILHGTNPPSWLVRFRGTHPTAINSLLDDCRRNIVNLERRPVADIESLLSSWRYWTATFLLHYLYYFVQPLSRALRYHRDTDRNLLLRVSKLLRRIKACRYRG